MLRMQIADRARATGRLAALLGAAAAGTLAVPPARAQVEEKTYAELGIDPPAANGGLTPADPDGLLAWLGPPSDADVGPDCAPASEAFAARLVREPLGKDAVMLLAPATESLRAVMARIAAEAPELHARLGTAGGLCIRTVRGSQALSVHAFGIALDLTVDGVLDAFGDGRASAELAQVAPFFVAEGWFRGAGLRSDDAMHFEASRALVDRWIAAGP